MSRTICKYDTEEGLAEACPTWSTWEHMDSKLHALGIVKRWMTTRYHVEQIEARIEYATSYAANPSH